MWTAEMVQQQYRHQYVATAPPLALSFRSLPDPPYIKRSSSTTMSYCKQRVYIDHFKGQCEMPMWWPELFLGKLEVDDFSKIVIVLI